MNMLPAQPESMLAFLLMRHTSKRASEAGQERKPAAHPARRRLQANDPVDDAAPDSAFN